MSTNTQAAKRSTVILRTLVFGALIVEFAVMVFVFCVARGVIIQSNNHEYNPSYDEITLIPMSDVEVCTPDACGHPQNNIPLYNPAHP